MVDDATTRACESQDSTKPNQLEKLTHPRLLFDAYTFRWLMIIADHDTGRNQQQASTSLANIALISTLILAVFATLLQTVAATKFDECGEEFDFCYGNSTFNITGIPGAEFNAHSVKGVSGAALSAGIVFLVISAVDSVLLLLAVNDAEDDHQVTILLKELGLWFTVPALLFYLGTVVGTLGWLVWLPTVFDLLPTLFVVAVMVLLGLTINIWYYHLIVLYVYEARAKCDVPIPKAPAWFTNLDWSKENSRESSAFDDPDANAATHILSIALTQVGFNQAAQERIMKKFGRDEWIHVDALHDIAVSDVVKLGVKPGAAARFVRSVREQLPPTNASELVNV